MEDDSLKMQAPEGLSGEQLEQLVDDDLLKFQEWFCTHVDNSTVALSGPEKAILKTYLWYKLHG